MSCKMTTPEVGVERWEYELKVMLWVIDNYFVLMEMCDDDG